MKQRVVVVGSLNMDLVVNTEKIPMIGETVLGGEFMTAMGGKGANQAVACARLGGDVYMVGCVGNDVFGMDMVNNLISNNVNADNVMTIDGQASGIAMITVKDGNNSIIVAPGANARLSPKMIRGLEELIKNSVILVIQLEIPLDTVYSAVDIANKHNVKVLLNPAPAIKLSDDFLRKVDILTPNESEAEILTGMSVKSIDDAKAAARYLYNKGVKQVVITLGGNGFVYSSGGDIIHRPVKSVKVVDTTAAGDSFTGALAYAFSQGRDIEFAMDLASAVGSITVTKKGAQTSLPYMEEVIKFMAE